MIEGQNKNIKKNTRNLKERLIEFFKDPKEVISFFLPILITICLILPVPYYIKIGGGTIKIDDKIKIKESYKTKGSLEALYVRESKGVVLTYLLSYVIPSFEKEEIEDVVYNNEDEKDYNYREKMYFTTSLDAATKVAFEKAGKPVKISSSKFTIIYIDKSARTNLEVGDEILTINGKKISTYDDMINITDSKKKGDKLTIIVKRDGEKVKTTSTLIEIDNKPKLGIVLANEIDYESDPKVNFTFNGKQAGPSGGLMISLSIYNKLVKEDITHGKKVVGTGTIDTEGNIGIIGGIKHKLMAANRKNADIVIVPIGNYKEAKKIKSDKGYKFNLISAKTFDEAIEKLEKAK